MMNDEDELLKFLYKWLIVFSSKLWHTEVDPWKIPSQNMLREWRPVWGYVGTELAHSSYVNTFVYDIVNICKISWEICDKCLKFEGFCKVPEWIYHC